MGQVRNFDSEVQELIEGLNVDLANEYASAIMYTNYAAVVSGIHTPMLRSFFEAEIGDEQGHAQYLATKIRTLGGTPVTAPADIPQTFDVRAMLESARDAEAATIERYVERRQQAEALGMIELQNKLDDLIDDETGHKEQIERMLEDLHLS
ncbi:ferritin-like domain-containing protein [Marinococcus halotolerans]|jgi:bacterioferritin|uniref:ferritin-like domain-containing protein n=1 Tax=Marinococcus halotolerans TaxID=301092 RepID=UPI0003B55CD9|nr:ferritin-like domain-containing protein [Marinococcus halotolerans]